MTARRPRSRLRPWLARVHRWGGLLLGLWFLVVGASGSVLVWHSELDAVLNPQWFAAASACPSSETPIAVTLDVFARARPTAQATMVMAPERPGAAFVVWAAPDADGARPQHFIDPHCGVHLGVRDWGALHADRAHLIPALYDLHRALWGGVVGHIVVGVLGLLLIALMGAALPLAWPGRGQPGGWRRVLSVKTGSSRVRLLFDLHRASGLWLGVVLLLLALTGAYLCFPAQGRALVAAALPTGRAPPPPHAAPSPAPDALVAHAESLLPHGRWSRLSLPNASDAGYHVRLLQADEPRKDTGDTRVSYAADGHVTALHDPLQAPSGEVLLAWLFPLHSGEALGPIGRVAWTAIGLLPGLLFVTGAWLWWRRRRLTARRTTDATTGTAMATSRT